MIAGNVHIDAKSLVQGYDRLNKQFNNIVSDALNGSVYSTLLYSRGELHKRFDIRSKWVEKGFRYIKSTPRQLKTTLYHRDGYMLKQETGAIVRKRGHNVAIPTDTILPKSRARVRKRDYAKQLMNTRTTTHSKRKGTRVKRYYRIFAKGTKLGNHTLKSRTMFRVIRNPNKNQKELESVYTLKKSVKVPKRWHWVQSSTTHFTERFRIEFHNRYQKTLKPFFS